MIVWQIMATFMVMRTYLLACNHKHEDKFKERKANKHTGAKSKYTEHNKGTMKHQFFCNPVCWKKSEQLFFQIHIEKDIMSQYLIFTCSG